MSNASLDDWLRQLEQLHPVAIELGLERVAEVAGRLRLLAPGVPVVTVAGTNGKGSTVAVLESLAAQCGLRAGVYTSPHFLRFNERIRVAGEEASDAQLCAAFEAIESQRGDVSLTYFEFATLAALWVFERESLDVIVLEVGLGGRLDAVNIIDPSVAVITSIALDHQEWLGDTLDDIAREKAGILREGVPAVIGDPAPPAGLRAAVRDAGAAPAFWLGREFTVDAGGGGAAQWSCAVSADGASRGFGPFAESGLLPENVAAAIQAAQLLGWPLAPDTVLRAVAGARPTGRRETRQIGGRHYVLDVAHNPAAAARLAQYLLQHPVPGRTVAVFSVMSDKDSRAMFAATLSAVDAWFLADQPANPRAADAAALAGILREAGAGMTSLSRNLRQALRRAQSITGEGDRIVVFGSFYTVAGVLPSLEKESAKYGVA